MYLGGGVRLWLFEPPGSPNCPSNLPGGCYNTGLLDGCGDPQQFAKFEDLQAYANGRGETLRQVGSAAEAMTLCKGGTPVAPPQAPIYVPPPVLSQVAAPDYVNTTRTPSGAAILPTGVATPTAPQVIVQPSGNVSYVPITTPQEQAPPQQAGFELSGVLPYAALAIAALVLMRKGK